MKGGNAHVFDDFWQSGAHGATWPNATHIYFWFTFSFKTHVKSLKPAKKSKSKETSVYETIVYVLRDFIRNTHGSHAEISLIKKVTDYMRMIISKWQVKLKDPYGCLQIYINYTPCSDCSVALSIFRENMALINIFIDIEIKAVAPYTGSKRVSCSYCAVNSYTTIGLINLLKSRIMLSAFSWDDWKFLTKKCNEGSDEEEGKVYKYSDLFPGYGHGKKDSRKTADQAVKQDFRWYKDKARGQANKK